MSGRNRSFEPQTSQKNHVSSGLSVLMSDTPLYTAGSHRPNNPRHNPASTRSTKTPKQPRQLHHQPGQNSPTPVTPPTGYRSNGTFEFVKAGVFPMTVQAAGFDKLVLLAHRFDLPVMNQNHPVGSLNR